MELKIAYIAAYVGAALASLGLTPLVAHLARRLGFVDMPHIRKVHSNPTPRVGGVAIGLAMLAAVAPALWLPLANRATLVAEHDRVIVLLSCSMFVLLVGLLDDLRTIRSQYKLFALIGAATMVCLSGTCIDELHLGSWSLPLGDLGIPLTVVWIVAVTVSINFIDGLDGLAAGIAGIACATLAVAALVTGRPVVALLALGLFGSLSGFLVFNFNPARVFMGDSGSMFVGFTLATCSVLCAVRVGTAPGMLMPALTLSIPLVDGLLTFVRRSSQRRSIFAAERGHIHHRLLDIGLCQKHAVLLLYGVSLMAAGVAIAGLFLGGRAAAVGLCLLALTMGALFRAAGSMRAGETVAAIRRNRAIARESRRNKTAFDELQLRFRAARTFGQWWEAACHAADALSFVSLALPLTNRDGTARLLHWRRVDGELTEDQAISAALPVRQRRDGGTTRATAEIAAGRFLETAGQRLTLFARLIAEYSVADLPQNSQCEPRSAAVPFSEQVESVSPIRAARAAFKTADAPAAAPVRPPAAGGKPRVAIVHDFLYVYAGAERVLEQILAVYPDADLFSLFDFVPSKERAFLNGKEVETSFLQKMPLARGHHRAYLPLMPLAIEQLNVSQYDIVISSSYCVAKGIITRPGQLHVCYCHTPVRYAWDQQSQYLDRGAMSPKSRGAFGFVKSMAARALLHYIRGWDIQSSGRVDFYVTNSDYVGRRIEKIYRRQSATIYPPVDTQHFTPAESKEDFYVTASRLAPYKRIDLIVEAFAKMPNRRLIVVGDGVEMESLRAKAGPNVRLVGHQSNDDLRRYLQLARAFLFAAEEDFGIAPVEAMACGTPVIAFGRGGVTETVIPGVTGLLFPEQTPASLIRAIEEFEALSSQKPWDPAAIRRNAERFSIARFRSELAMVVAREWAGFERNQQGTTMLPTPEPEITPYQKRAGQTTEPDAEREGAWPGKLSPATI